ncbi:MAG: VCBS repeat-containing protein [Proteobacteria bacterium]|nr:VCBS repeat-containing protein [Pseudomonadota bacterium]
MSKINFNIFRLYSIGLILIAFVFLNFYSATAAESKRIALLPFKINSEKDLSFLRDGIFDMLSTRLAKEGQVEVISRVKVEEAMQPVAGSGSVNETRARGIGTRLNADFVLFGSLTVLGDNVSIDAKMVDITGGKPTMTFYDQSQNLGAVITKINLIAADINDRMFGRTPAAAAKAPVPAAKPQKTAKSDIHAHPEKVLRDDGFITSGGEDAEGLGIAPGAARETQASFWKSASFKHLINGVAVGDVDGDGKNETVTAAPHMVTIFRSERGAFRKLAEIEESSNKNIYGLDIADINNNGYAEIFVTSFNAEKNVVNSFILEYDGKNYVKIIDNSRLIYRVADTPNRGRVLLGQRPSKGRSDSGPVFEMIWQGGEYVPTDEIRIPRHTSLLGLTIGDVLNNGQENAIGYKENDHIQVIDSSGNTIWDSPDRYGGSMLFWDAPWDDRGLVENKKYFPIRLVVWQNTATKESQVIAVKNHDITTRKMDLRMFTKTHIEAFTWDGLGLRPIWKTRTLKGFIQDYTVGDFDNDGNDELVVALVIKEGRVAVFTEAKSTILAYDLVKPAGNDE